MRFGNIRGMEEYIEKNSISRRIQLINPRKRNGGIHREVWRTQISYDYYEPYFAKILLYI